MHRLKNASKPLFIVKSISFLKIHHSLDDYPRMQDEDVSVNLLLPRPCVSFIIAVAELG